MKREDSVKIANTKFLSFPHGPRTIGTGERRNIADFISTTTDAANDSSVRIFNGHGFQRSMNLVTSD